ncbi:hypothetical protein SteCoe_6567 [Stentor coeruleus]|uniref:Uncharacterized protein n=1 Tax=Stentor coeruleus TaxID=5963 RepID=A0A1R2CPR7_9CILI|nr:hypothetical protein SteCoe_6567 [Stentor coeruleus]
MIGEKSHINSSIPTKNTRYSLEAIRTSPYSNSTFKKRYSNYKKSSFSSTSNNGSIIIPSENSNIKTNAQIKTMKIRNLNESLTHIEKSKYLSIKLAKNLSNKNHDSSYFSIYSEIFSELIELFPIFKDLFLSLKKGMVISAIKEKDYEDFEFCKDLKGLDSDLQCLFNKERVEKSKLVKKLDVLAIKYMKLKEKYDEILKINRKYEKIIFPNMKEIDESIKNPQKINVSNKDILQRQNTWLHVLKKINNSCEDNEDDENSYLKS